MYVPRVGRNGAVTPMERQYSYEGGRMVRIIRWLSIVTDYMASWELGESFARGVIAESVAVQIHYTGGN